MHRAVSLLVIDDNQGCVDLLSGSLAQPGLEIFAATDPAEAIKIFERERPQMVVTDLVMSGMSGMQVLERIMDIDPATDVIMLTAHDTTDTAVEAMRKGASDYFTKPASPGLLRKRVAALVEEAQGRSPSGCEDVAGIVGQSTPIGTCFRVSAGWLRTIKRS